MNMKYINGSEIGKTKIGIYRHITDTSGKLITIETYFEKFVPAYQNDVIRLRHLPTEDEKKKYKAENLAAATFSCICGEDKSQVLERNDLIVIDIDYKDNVEKFEEVDARWWQMQLYNLPYVYASNVSASGKGIYLIIPIDNPDDKTFKAHFKALERDFMNQLGIKIDKSCKNVNRLRFISWDSWEIMYKADEDVAYYEDAVYEEVYDESKYSRYDIKFNEEDTGKKDMIHDMDLVYNTVSSLIKDGYYRTTTYDEWCLEAYRLNALGETGRQLFHELSAASASYDGPAVCDRQFNNCRDTRFALSDSVLHFYHMAKLVYGNDWKNKVKNNDKTL